MAWLTRVVAARHAASTVGTGFTAARLISSCRRCITTTTRSVRPRRPEDGYHLSGRSRRPRDRVHRRPARGRRRDSRSSVTSQPAHATRRTTHRRNGSRSTRATSTSAGTRGAKRRSRASSRRAYCRTAPQLTPRPRWVPAWDSLRAEDQAVAARFMECFAAYLSYTDAQIGRVLDFLAETGDLDNTLVIAVSDNGASAEGGAKGSINDGRLVNGAPAGRRELRARIDEIGSRDRAQQLPVGLDDGRQHAVQAVEARGARRRRRRPVHRVVAGTQSTGATSAASSRTRSTCLPTVLELVGIELPDTIARSNSPTSTARASRSVLRDRRRARDPHDAVLRDARFARHLPRRLESGDVPPDRGRCTTTASIPTRRSTTTCGSCTTSPSTSRSRTTSPREEPERLADDGRPVVGGSASQRRVAARQPAVVRDLESASVEPPASGDVRPLPAGRRAGAGVDRR